MSSESDSNDGSNEDARYEVPGGPTLIDKRTPPSVDHIACPFCEYTDSSERLVRAHITREDDAAHRDRDGFDQQTCVHARDADGEIIESVPYERSEVAREEGSMNFELLPDGLTEKQEQILSVAVVKPKATINEIRETVAERYGEKPSHGYAAEVISDHLAYREPNSGGQAYAESFDELTPKQSALANELLAEPDPLDAETWSRSRKEIAAAASERLPEGETVGATYINYLQKQYGDLLEEAAESASSPDDTFECQGCGQSFKSKGGLGNHRKHCVPFQEHQEAVRAEIADDGPEPSSEPEAAQQAAEEPDGPVYDPDSEVVVSKDRMRAFDQRLQTLQESAERQHDASPRDSPMRAHADGKMELIDIAAEFLADVAENNRQRTE